MGSRLPFGAVGPAMFAASCFAARFGETTAVMVVCADRKILPADSKKHG